MADLPQLVADLQTGLRSDRFNGESKALRGDGFWKESDQVAGSGNNPSRVTPTSDYIEKTR
jgi:hypothetical protein